MAAYLPSGQEIGLFRIYFCSQVPRSACISLYFSPRAAIATYDRLTRANYQTSREARIDENVYHYKNTRFVVLLAKAVAINPCYLGHSLSPAHWAKLSCKGLQVTLDASAHVPCCLAWYQQTYTARNCELISLEYHPNLHHLGVRLFFRSTILHMGEDPYLRRGLSSLGHCSCFVPMRR